MKRSVFPAEVDAAGLRYTFENQLTLNKQQKRGTIKTLVDKPNVQIEEYTKQLETHDIEDDSLGARLKEVENHD